MEASPGGGGVAGHEGGAAYFERVDAAGTIETFEVVEIIAQDDRAAVTTRLSVRFRGNGRTLTLPKADIVRVRDGKIADFCGYYDTALVVETMRDGEEPAAAVRVPPA